MGNIVHSESHISKRTRIINHFVALALCVTGLAVGILLFWSFQDTNILTVHNAPFPVRTISANGDNIVILHLDYCKNLSVRGKLRESFVSKTREVFLPLSDDDQPARCLNADVPIIIPVGLIPDTYRIHFKATYKVNPLKTTIQEYDSRDFQIK